jgi:D-lactate dehydrogenase (cytochrome)
MSFASEYSDYLADESRSVGRADSISFPVNVADVVAKLAELAEAEELVTVQSGLTGIAGGAVPDGGHILNLSRMDRMLGLRQDSEGNFYVKVEAGCTLQKLRDVLRSGNFDSAGWSTASLDALAAYRSGAGCMFPPDLTESSACLGGVVANNGSGARTFMYGAARAHVVGLGVVLVNGDRICLQRYAADGYAPYAVGREFELKTEGGRMLSGSLPSYEMPHVKNAAGYYSADNMALIDVFIGSEGTLGVITDVELRLTAVPQVMWGLTSFFQAEADALGYVEAVRAKSDGVAAIEFFSSEALDLLRSQQNKGGAFENLPELKSSWHTAVYVELHCAEEAVAEELLMQLSELMLEWGGDPDDSWFAGSEADIERFKGIRHAVPESVNMLIASRKKKIPELTKLGTDLAVPDAVLRDVMQMYHRDLRDAGLEYVIFGHIGNNHVHVNILPRSLAEYARGKKLYMDWARKVVAMGGTVSAEHGIGKLKRDMLQIMYGNNGIDAMCKLKQIFDPEWRLNRGTLLPVKM